MGWLKKILYEKVYTGTKEKEGGRYRKYRLVLRGIYVRIFFILLISILSILLFLWVKGSYGDFSRWLDEREKLDQSESMENLNVQ
jgi:hypothetical protein